MLIKHDCQREENKKHQNGHLKTGEYSLTQGQAHRVCTGAEGRLFCHALGRRSNAEEERGRMKQSKKA